MRRLGYEVSGLGVGGDAGICDGVIHASDGVGVVDETGSVVGETGSCAGAAHRSVSEKA